MSTNNNKAPTAKLILPDLTTLKKLTNELEVALVKLAELKKNSNLDNQQYLLELAKVSGIANGVAIEGSMLFKDCSSLITHNLSSAPQSKSDLLDSLFGAVGIKSPTGTSN